MKPSIPVSLILSVACWPCRPTFPSSRWSSTSTASASSNAPARSAPGESARLDFNAAEMNDVLKSLTIGAGRRQNLRPALRFAWIPLSHKLAEFPFQIGGGGCPGMLDQLKGARVELKFGNETVAGAIVSAPHHSPAAISSPSANSSTSCSIAANCAPSTSAPPPACASPIRSCSSSSRTTWPRWPPRAPRTSAASTSIPPMPRSATSPPAT